MEHLISLAITAPAPSLAEHDVLALAARRTPLSKCYPW